MLYYFSAKCAPTLFICLNWELQTRENRDLLHDKNHIRQGLYYVVLNDIQPSPPFKTLYFSNVDHDFHEYNLTLEIGKIGMLNIIKL
jgi:hypothetical protein